VPDVLTLLKGLEVAVVVFTAPNVFIRLST
jgi:hypothetical protein